MTKTFITYKEILKARKNGMNLYGDIDNALLTRTLLIANNFEKNNQPIDRKALDALLWLLVVEKGFESDETLAEKAEAALAEEVGTLKNSVHDVSVILTDDDEYTVFLNMTYGGSYVDGVTVGHYDTEEDFEEILADLISLSSKYNIRFLSYAGYETNREPEIDLLRVNFSRLAYEMTK